MIQAEDKTGEVRVVRGDKNRVKTVAVRGASASAIEALASS